MPRGVLHAIEPLAEHIRVAGLLGRGQSPDNGRDSSAVDSSGVAERLRQGGVPTGGNWDPRAPLLMRTVDKARHVAWALRFVKLGEVTHIQVGSHWILSLIHI